MRRIWKKIAIGSVVSVVAIAGGCGRKLPKNVSPDLEVAKSLRAELAAGGGEAESGDSPSATAATPTGWATLSGVFKVTGDRPSAASLASTRIRACVRPAGSRF